MIPREQPQPQPPQTIPVLGRPHHHKLFGWSVLPPPIKRWRTNTQITTPPHVTHTHTHVGNHSRQLQEKTSPETSVGRSPSSVDGRLIFDLRRQDTMRLQPTSVAPFVQVALCREGDHLGNRWGNKTSLFGGKTGWEE